MPFLHCILRWATQHMEVMKYHGAALSLRNGNFTTWGKHTHTKIEVMSIEWNHDANNGILGLPTLTETHKTRSTTTTTTTTTRTRTRTRTKSNKKKTQKTRPCRVGNQPYQPSQFGRPPVKLNLRCPRSFLHAAKLTLTAWEPSWEKTTAKMHGSCGKNGSLTELIIRSNDS